VLKPDIGHGLLFLFVCFSYLSVIWSVDPESTVGRVTIYTLQLGFLWLILQLVESARDAHVVLGAYVLGAVAAASYTIHEYRSGVSFANSGRYTAANADPNELALAMALAIPIAWYLGFTVSTRLLRIGFRASLMVLLAGIALTGSRGGVIATLV